MKKSAVAVLLVVLCPAALAATAPTSGKVAFTSTRDGNDEIYAMNANGSAQTRLTNNAATDSHPSWSPNNSKIAFVSNRDGNDEIYVMNANGSNQTRITNNPATDSNPTWSSDGTQLVFVSTRNGGFDIFKMSADGSNVVQLTNDPGFDSDPAFSPNGNKIVFASSRDGNSEIYSMNPDGSGQTRLTNNTLFDARPDFSPNAQLIVYSSNVPSGSGFTQQVVIMNADGSSSAVLTSQGANGNPTFGGDGKHIFFNSTRDLNTEVYSMELDGSDAQRLTHNAASDALPSVQRIRRPESIGVYRPTTGQWFLRNTNTTGPPNFVVTFGGQPGDLPFTGDWNGDGRTDVGVFNGGTFRRGVLVTSLGQTFVADLDTIQFGVSGDLPIAGDWDGDDEEDLGVYRPSTGKFRVRVRRPLFPNQFMVITFDFGESGDLPVAGDWNGDGTDSPGVFRPDFKGGLFLLTDGLDSSVEITFPFGLDTQPVAGDWLGTGLDNVGLYDANVSTFFLTTSFAGDVAFSPVFGLPGDLPVAGSWTP